MQLKLLKGLPGSGKTSLALKQCWSDPQWRRVNKDDIRTWWLKERSVVKIERIAAEKYLKQGFSVVVDDTNFNPDHEKFFKELAFKYKAEYTMVFVNTPLQECLRRNALRTGKERVPEEVIHGMYKKYLTNITHSEYSWEAYLDPYVGFATRRDILELADLKKEGMSKVAEREFLNILKTNRLSKKHYVMDIGFQDGASDHLRGTMCIYAKNADVARPLDRVLVENSSRRPQRIMYQSSSPKATLLSDISDTPVLINSQTYETYEDRLGNTFFYA